MQSWWWWHCPVCETDLSMEWNGTVQLYGTGAKQQVCYDLGIMPFKSPSPRAMAPSMYTQHVAHVLAQPACKRRPHCCWRAAQASAAYRWCHCCRQSSLRLSCHCCHGCRCCCHCCRCCRCCHCRFSCVLGAHRALGDERGLAGKGRGFGGYGRGRAPGEEQLWEGGGVGRD